MSNTELFDILDLARPKDDRANLQAEFCRSMKNWRPGDHHKSIMSWARKKDAPVVTVNFDRNLALAADAEFHRGSAGFTDFYPWNCYYSDRKIVEPRSSFAIWHAHGMMRYHRSIRLGLTHYMGSVQRARSLIYGNHGIRFGARTQDQTWRGSDTWLDVMFFTPLVIIGFGFGKDESFLRWLFLERARLHSLVPAWKRQTWYVTTASKDGRELHRKAFFEKLGMQFIIAPHHDAIYNSPVWQC